MSDAHAQLVGRDACLMRSDASQAAILCGLGSCRAPFVPRKPWQRYCCSAHRIEANKLRDDDGLRGRVTGNRILKNGDHSITLRVPASEDVSHLPPGTVAEIV